MHFGPPTIRNPHWPSLGHGCRGPSPRYSGLKAIERLNSLDSRSTVPGGIVERIQRGAVIHSTHSSTADRSQLKPSKFEGVGTHRNTSPHWFMSAFLCKELYSERNLSYTTTWCSELC